MGENWILQLWCSQKSPYLHIGQKMKHWALILFHANTRKLLKIVFFFSGNQLLNFLPKRVRQLYMLISHKVFLDNFWFCCAELISVFHIMCFIKSPLRVQCGSSPPTLRERQDISQLPNWPFVLLIYSPPVANVANRATHFISLSSSIDTLWNEGSGITRPKAKTATRSRLTLH